MPEFNGLLGATIAEWAQRIQVQSKLVGKTLSSEVTYNGQSIVYEPSVLSNDHVVTAGEAASALWAMTAVVRRGKDLRGFSEIMGTSYRDTIEQREDKMQKWLAEPKNIAMHDEWKRVAAEAIALFGAEWGDDRLLRQRANADA